MNKPKFTPGPWWVLHEGSSEVSAQADGTCICYLNFDPLPKEETKKHLANACLIAAAPDMYAELERIADVLEDPEDCGEISLDRINSVLRKARGESEDGK